MRTTILQHAAVAAIGGILALAAITGPVGHLAGAARAASQVAQYCAPPQKDSEAPTLYCREHG
jgi:hypothetical protein